MRIAQINKRLLPLVLIPSLSGCFLFSSSPPPAVNDYVEGSLALDQGNKDKAIASLVQATQKNPKLILARSKLGDIYREDGDYNKALEQYQALTRLDPYTSANHYRLGVTYQFLDRLQEAVASYLKALQLDPQDARSSMNVGLCYLTLGQPADALKFTRRATELSPALAATWSNYGVTLDSTAHFADAERAYERALELDSRNPVTLYNLASNLVEQKKYAQAAPILEGLVRQHDSAPSRKRLGDAYAGLHRDKDALAEYVAACQLDKNYYPAFNEAGRALLSEYKTGLQLDEKQRQSAVLMWKQSLQVNPDQPQIEALVKQWDRPG